jgi:hypothetical protein
MRKFLTASKDTTLYQAFPAINAGVDEILDIGKVIDSNAVITDGTYATGSARALLYFDLPTTASVFSGSRYYLNLKLANAEKVKKNQTLLVYNVSRSWDEGSGYFEQRPVNTLDGATWRQLSTGVSWSMEGGDFLTTSVSQSTTVSTYPLQDLRVDVTTLIQPIVSQALQNTFHGLVVQFPIQDEQDKQNQGIIKVFSTQTHTVHQPTLEIAWDNQTFITGSLKPIPSLNVKITPTNLREVYTKGDVDRINLVVRDQYPLKSFDSTLRYNNKYYLPTSSYFSIVDIQSNITVIPFDEFSKISTDSGASYIVLDTTPLYVGRFYKIKLHVVAGDYSKTIDTETIFRIM